MNTNVLDHIPPHHIIQNFLGNDLIERLLAYVTTHENNFEQSQIGLTQNGMPAGVNPKIRVSKVLSDFGILKTEVEERFRAVRQQALVKLNFPSFELSRCEIELAAHGNGDFLKRHIDTLLYKQDTQSQRVLTGVLYFHSLPKSYSGGQLRMYAFSSRKSGEHFIDIEPERDQLVLFPSIAPHEVLPVTCPSGEFSHSRFTLNCWYRRPAPPPRSEQQ